jgi:hypothetical protein
MDLNASTLWMLISTVLRLMKPNFATTRLVVIASPWSCSE